MTNKTHGADTTAKNNELELFHKFFIFVQLFTINHVFLPNSEYLTMIIMFPEAEETRHNAQAVLSCW